MRVTIGRSPENSLVISDDAVSGHHAVIEEVDGFQTLIDLGSSNGSFVNGVKITRHLLEAGDEIKFGESKFVWNGLALRARDAAEPNYFRYLPPPGATTNSTAAKVLRNRIVTLVVGIGLVGVILGMGIMVLGGSSVSADDLAKRTVYVEMTDTSGEPCWSGSGAVVLDGSYILTNAHVASADPTDEDSVTCTKLRVGIVERASEKPSKFLGATVVESSKTYDLALLKINLGESYSLTPFKVREEELGLDVPIRVIGFPGLGGGTVTLTSGVTSGIDDSDVVDYYKVSATINHGNSGGPVVDDEGNLVAIATAFYGADIDCSGNNCVTDGVALGLARPIKFALPFLRNHDK